jgi:ribosome-associated protein
LTPETLLDAITASLDDNKAIETVIIALEGKSSIADYMVVASGQSQRHVSSAAEHLVYALKRQGVGHVGIEGLSTGDWVLIDAGDVVVHLLRPEIRAFYGLERLWGSGEPASVAG